jgi:hypothetical protein
MPHLTYGRNDFSVVNEKLLSLIYEYPTENCAALGKMSHSDYKILMDELEINSGEIFKD